MSSNVVWRRAVAAAAFSALSATSAFAQAGGVGVIEGVVKDGQSGRPIEGVQVALFEALGAGRMVSAGVGALTNRDGIYRIASAPARAFTLRARFIGYTAVDKPVVVRVGTTVRVEFEMQQSALQLGAVVTTGTAAIHFS